MIRDIENKKEVYSQEQLNDAEDRSIKEDYLENEEAAELSGEYQDMATPTNFQNNFSVTENDSDFQSESKTVVISQKKPKDNRKKAAEEWEFQEKLRRKKIKQKQELIADLKARKRKIEDLESDPQKKARLEKLDKEIKEEENKLANLEQTQLLSGKSASS